MSTKINIAHLPHKKVGNILVVELNKKFLCFDNSGYVLTFDDTKTLYHCEVNTKFITADLYGPCTIHDDGITQTGVNFFLHHYPVDGALKQKIEYKIGDNTTDTFSHSKILGNIKELRPIGVLDQDYRIKGNNTVEVINRQPIYHFRDGILNDYRMKHPVVDKIYSPVISRSLFDEKRNRIILYEMHQYDKPKGGLYYWEDEFHYDFDSLQFIEYINKK